MLGGGCLCGSIRYEIAAAPFDCTVCHCVDCRRASGAPFVAWFSVPQHALRFVAGAPAVFASSPGVERSFCPTCGTPLTYRHAAFAGEIDVTAGSLDRPDDVPPAHHTWASQKLGWVKIADGRPQHPRAVPDT